MQSEKKGNSATFDTQKIDAQLQKWREKLIDLTKSNPLLRINYSRVSKLQAIEPGLSELFDAIVKNTATLKMPLVKKKAAKKAKKKRKSTDKDQQQIIKEETPEEEEPTYTLEPGDITFNKTPKELWQLMRRLHDNARVTVEERGVTTLHLVFGALRWDDPNLDDAVSPLILVPCEFEYTGPNAHMKLKMLDEEIQLNPALELILRDKHKIQLPSLPEGDEDLNLESFLQEIAAQVKEQGWTVLPEVWLSTFSFDSLAIYKDLEALVGIAHTHPLIAALARAGALDDASEALEVPHDLDSHNAVPVPVLEADSSQLAALTLASTGTNLVVHGPPGTGKSQTITNLIADALGAGKKVLFVSAKMAALNVVHDRLAAIGLGRFCLEAHSTKAGKAKIIEELKRTIDLPVAANNNLLEEQLAELQRVRSNLNTYVQELHVVREPLGISLYQALGKVEKFNKTPDLRGKLPWENLSPVTREELRTTIELLRDVASQSSVYDNRDNHPWNGFQLNNERGEENQEKLREKLEKLLDIIQSIANSLSVVDKLFVISGTVSIKKLLELQQIYEMVSGISELPTKWLTLGSETHIRLAKLFSDAGEKIAAYKKLKEAYKAITTEAAKEIIALLSPIESEYKNWTRLTKPAFWKWRSELKKHFHESAVIKIGTLQEYLELAKKIDVSEKWFEEQSKDLSRYAINPLQVSTEVYEEQSKQFLVASKLVQLANDQKINFPEQDITLLPEITIQAKKIAQQLSDNSLPDILSFINTHWLQSFADNLSVKDADIDAVVSKSKELIGALAKCHEWVVLQVTLKKCSDRNLIDFVKSLDKESATQLPDALEKKFYKLWAGEVLGESSVLQEFSGMRREERIEHFHALDRQIKASVLKKIQMSAAEPARRVMSAQGDFGSRSEAGILFRELQKRRRFKPLRKLFGEIPHVLQALKPCLLMSPTSVSTFLKPGLFSFDIVVFDEASQLPTQEGIAAILRSRQVVVAGDENQLPPTTFFDSSTWFEQDENDDESEPLESLLDDCCAIHPFFTDERLLWHYRSKDERLIKFSNHYIYNNSLVTFPSATIDPEGRGVRLVYLPNGTWDRGKSRTNRVEARAVAQLVIDQFEKQPERSVGVVAMNSSQKDAIELALDELTASRPHLAGLLDTQKNEPFFIKSLENVQGDERDIIIISVGYAKSPKGALSYSFGPLNRDGGWRRLNVLVTRAKWQTVLVTSLRSQELGGISPNNRGAIMLRNYIEYAEKGAELPAEATVLTKEETNDFENGVASALRDAGCLVDEQVGASGYRIDLAIRDPRDNNRYLLAVECDGATYHSSRTARDRDMLRQDVLRSQGWKMYRLWSTDWFRDRDAALQSLLNAVNVALQHPTDESVQAPPLEQKDLEAEIPNEETNTISHEAISDRKYNPGVPYRKMAITRHLSPEIIMKKSRKTDFAKTVALIVQEEGPIHGDILLERLRELFAVSRVGNNIMKNLNVALHYAGTRYKVELKDDFIYGANKPSNFRINTEEVQRSIEQIAPEEISLAACYLVEDQFGFARESLPKAILEVLGLKRATSEALDHVSSIIETLISKNTLQLSGGNMLYLN